MASFLRKIVRTLCKSCDNTLSPDREAMKYTSEKELKTISAASHAQANAAAHNSASSQEMRKTADALASLARHIQGM